MADVSECITKLVATGAISRAIGDEALEMFKRSRAEYSRTMGPSSADACRWPVDGSGYQAFCGADRFADHLPYCLRHCHMAYRPPERRAA